MPPDRGRASKACSACRKQKTRCYASEKGHAACLRCETLGHQCSLVDVTNLNTPASQEAASGTDARYHVHHIRCPDELILTILQVKKTGKRSWPFTWASWRCSNSQRQSFEYSCFYYCQWKLERSICSASQCNSRPGCWNERAVSRTGSKWVWRNEIWWCYRWRAAYHSRCHEFIVHV